MASVKFAKGSEEWQMFMDYWTLCQKHWIPDETEEYWQGLIDDINVFYKKYNAPFAKGLYQALHDELERKMKDGSG